MIWILLTFYWLDISAVSTHLLLSIPYIYGKIEWNFHHLAWKRASESWASSFYLEDAPWNSVLIISVESRILLKANFPSLQQLQSLCEVILFQTLLGFHMFHWNLRELTESSFRKIETVWKIYLQRLIIQYRAWLQIMSVFHENNGRKVVKTQNK